MIQRRQVKKNLKCVLVPLRRGRPNGTPVGMAGQLNKGANTWLFLVLGCSRGFLERGGNEKEGEIAVLVF